MKKWMEARRILAAIDGSPAALATVIGVQGSAYRRPGARLLIRADGRSVGNVSGGCLEEDVREVGLRVIATGRAEVRHYCSGADPVAAWDLGVGCEGEVEVLVQPLPPDFVALAGVLDGDEAFSYPVRHEGRVVYLDTFTPPPRLAIFGAGDDALPVARLALEVGFRVTVVDRRPALLANFPNEAVRVHAPPGTPPPPCDFALVMTHSFADDAAWVRTLEEVPHLGVLGPRARTERMTDPDDPRVFSPVGLDLGGEGAEQVAVAIVAELLALHHGRPARSLRERCAPIHAARG